jgi:hypothetical protein
MNTLRFLFLFFWGELGLRKVIMEMASTGKERWTRCGQRFSFVQEER